MCAWTNINNNTYIFQYIVYVRTTRAKLAEAISNCCELESNRALFGKVHLLCLYFPLERSYFFLCIFLWSFLAFSISYFVLFIEKLFFIFIFLIPILITQGRGSGTTCELSHIFGLGGSQAS